MEKSKHGEDERGCEMQGNRGGRYTKHEFARLVILRHVCVAVSAEGVLRYHPSLPSPVWKKRTLLLFCARPKAGGVTSVEWFKVMGVGEGGAMGADTTSLATFWLDGGGVAGSLRQGFKRRA